MLWKLTESSATECVEETHFCGYIGWLVVCMFVAAQDK